MGLLLNSHSENRGEKAFVSLKIDLEPKGSPFVVVFFKFSKSKALKKKIITEENFCIL